MRKKITRYPKTGKKVVPEVEAKSLSEFVDCVEQIAGEWREFIAEKLQKQVNARTLAPPPAGGSPSRPPQVKGGPPLEMPGGKFPGEFVPWFRGVTNFKYHLEPSLLRDDGLMKEYNRNREQIRQIESYMLRRFRAAGVPLANLADTRPINWTYLMQHHGLQTRLLDWSKNALTALYFALRKHKS